MKTRQGLVSNSSSCSFTIAILPEENRPEDEETRIEILKMTLPMGHVTRDRLPYGALEKKEYISKLKKEIADLEKDMSYMQTIKEEMEDFDEAGMKTFALYKKWQGRQSPGHPQYLDIDYIRWERIRDEEKEEGLTIDLDMNWNIKKGQRLIDSLKEMLDKVNEVPDESTILSFDIENYYLSDVDKMLEYLKTRKWIHVIERVYG